MNAEKKQVEKYLKIAKGNLEATIKMLQDDRYCVDVSNQILAVEALIQKANALLLRQHIDHCVLSAFNASDEQRHKKIDEVLDLVERIIK